jgi:hypothetical protein
MPLSNQEKKILQKQFFEGIREKSKTWDDCYICGDLRNKFIPVEEIPMPVCIKHYKQF